MRIRHHVVETGPPAGRVVLLAHGFGCDQHMWRLVAPRLAETFRVVTFDFVGSGRSDRSAWDAQRYSSLDGYAQDVAQLCRELDLREVVFVGHSVSAMIGVLAARLEPQRFAKLVLVTPSPRYIDDGDYRGGFSRADIDELLESLSDNYLGWSATHGAGDHGQSRAAGAGRGVDEQLLPDGPARRPGVRPRHLPVRQPRRPREGRGPDAGAAVRAGRDRPTRGGGVRAGARSRGACWSRSTRPGTVRSSARRGRPPNRSSRSARRGDPAIGRACGRPQLTRGRGGHDRRAARGGRRRGGRGRTPPSKSSTRTRRAATCPRCPTAPSSRSTQRSWGGSGDTARTWSGAAGSRTCSPSAAGSTTRRTSRRC